MINDRESPCHPCSTMSFCRWEGETACISFYSWSFYGCFDHMLRYHFPPIELWCMEALLKIGYKSLALETDSWYLIGAFSNKLPVFFLCLQVSLPPLNNQKRSQPRFASLDWYFQSDCILAADFVLMKVYQPCLFCMWFTNLYHPFKKNIGCAEFIGAAYGWSFC